MAKGRRLGTWCSGACVVLLAAACACPQTTRPRHQPHPIPRPSFSATADVTWRPEGGSQTLTWTTSFARDARGRTFLETIVPGTASPDGAGEEVISVSDPVANLNWRIYPASGKAYPVTSGRSDVNELSGWLGAPLAPHPGAHSVPFVKLGTCTVAGQSGLARQGKYLYDDGSAAGFDQWCEMLALQLNIEFRQISADGTPRFTFTVTALKLGDPPASMFVPPASIPTPSGSADRALTATLFREARDAASILPPELDARMLQIVAGEEMNALPLDPDWRQQAWTDAVSTFHQIVGIEFPKPLPRPNSAPAWATFDPKESVEANLIYALMHDPGGRLTKAEMNIILDLARHADVRKAPLYDTLLGALPAEPSALAALGIDRVALVAECQATDGSFPYRGVQELIQGRYIRTAGGIKPSPQMLDSTAAATLLRMADAAAGLDADPAGLSEAVLFLEETAPASKLSPSPPRYAVDLTAFRADWEAAVHSLLRDYPQTPGAMPAQVAGLRSLLRQMNAPAAPQFTPNIQARLTGSVMVRNGGLLLPFSSTDLLSQDTVRSNPGSAFAQAMAQTGPPAAYNLTDIAVWEFHRDPWVAAHAAPAALAAIQTSPVSGPWAIGPDLLSGLLAALDDLGMTDRADTVIAFLVQRATNDALAAQSKFDDLPPDQRESGMPDGGAASEFAMIARVDLNAAVAAARSLDAPAVKPMVLSAVASQAH